jgi:hypothetical protein
MIFTSRNYSIGRAHFQIAGGMKTLLLLAATYIAAVSTVLGLFVYNEVPGRGYRALATLVMVIEAFVLVVIGSVRVGGCMRSDVMTHMIDSHRLMPVESWRAVAGYLFGTTMHVQMITVMNALFLAGLLSYTSLGFNEFVINQLVLAIFALFVWSFTAMGSLMVRQIMPVIVLAFVFGGIFSIALREYAILPGLSVLSSPFLGETIFSMMGGRFTMRETYPLALAAQVAFGTLFFIGACRRYRGSYPSTFSVVQGLALVLVWGIVSMVAIWLWEGMRFRTPWQQPGLGQQVVASLVVSAMLAIVPVHAFAAVQVQEVRKRGELLLVLIAVTLVSVVGILVTAQTQRPLDQVPLKWFLTVLVMGAHVLTMYMALRATRNMSQMAKGTLTVVVLFGVWVLPLLLEVGRWLMLTEATTGDESVYRLSALGSLSPLGLLMTQWTAAEAPTPIPGVIFQWLVPVGLWWLDRRLNRGAAGAGPSEGGRRPQEVAWGAEAGAVTAAAP